MYYWLGPCLPPYGHTDMIVGTQRDRQVYWPVAGPVTYGSGRETGVQVASLTDRGALRSVRHHGG